MVAGTLLDKFQFALPSLYIILISPETFDLFQLAPVTFIVVPVSPLIFILEKF
jgi:hypothetical protein